jgi:hypothetical protein
VVSARRMERAGFKEVESLGLGAESRT